MSVSKQFLLAGNATFTVECPKGAKYPHVTYKVEKTEKTERWDEAYFVKVLCGPNNEEDYVYLGRLDTFTGQLQLTRKSALPATAFRVRLLNKVLARVWADDHTAYEQHGYATHHEGRCGCCGRKLTVPASVVSGIGPECCKKMGLPVPARNRTRDRKKAPKTNGTPHTPGTATVSPYTGNRYTGD